MTGAELRARRHELGLSMERLAHELGVTLACVSRWETGSRPIRYPAMVNARLAEIAAALERAAEAMR